MTVSSEVCSFGFENRMYAEQALGKAVLSPHYMAPYADMALSGAVIGGEVNADAFDPLALTPAVFPCANSQPKASDVARAQLNREAGQAEAERRKKERAAQQQNNANGTQQGT